MNAPLSTYRLQFSPSFGFRRAEGLIPYLDSLGVSAIYASPVFRSRKGSLHGYDVVDPNAVDPELGTAEDFERLLQNVKAAGLGWVQDIVPNHMAYDYENTMLRDVLEMGRHSEYFRYFDIDWDHPYENLRGRVLAPFLGRFYSEALEDGEIQLRYEDGSLTVHYFESRFPLRSESYPLVFGHQAARLLEKAGPDREEVLRFLDLLAAVKQPPEEGGRTARARFADERNRLRGAIEASPLLRRHVDQALRAYNGVKGRPKSFARLDRLLSHQLFRLSFWKVATEELNYRRFFNVNGLIRLRTEDEAVMDACHATVLKLVREGKVSGLRIDHVDGLFDPAEYLARLSRKAGPVYVVVEKILSPGEELPAGWAVHGTTGYDWLNAVNALFCDGRNHEAFDGLYGRFTGLAKPYPDLVVEKKRLIIGKHMAGDIDNLAQTVKRLSANYRYGRDITLYALRRVIVEIIAQFPVYRTYRGPGVFSEQDREFLAAAIGKARDMVPELWYEVRLLENYLLSGPDEDVGDEARRRWLDFVMRFEQATAPLMAKGFEDTVLYVYNRLLSLNEVGGSPDRFGMSLDDFHAFNRARAERRPAGMNATSTHDTKRGEDARARLNVLSEIPKEWEKQLAAWRRIGARTKRREGEAEAPDRNDEYFLYQSLIGAFPLEPGGYPEFRDRLKAFIVKAVREAKVHTAWLKPETWYEDAFLAFVDSLLPADMSGRFLKLFLPFLRRVAFYGMLNSLSQTALKLASPGVPDFYQGTEFWDLSLVDPDNRRPVDFEARRAALEALRAGAAENLPELLAQMLSGLADGRAKLFLIARGLGLRRERIDVFLKGDYLALEARGRHGGHVAAFARRLGDRWVIAAVPRFLTGIVKDGVLPLGRDVWGDTAVMLPGPAPSGWRNRLTDARFRAGGELMAGDIFREFPVALLCDEGDR